MGLIFKKELIELIEKRIKTQTRRKHKYPLKMGKIYSVKENWFKSTEHRILITRVFRQRLSDITDEEAYKEGGYTIETFKEIWIKINDSWDPNEIVWVYEFKLLKNNKCLTLNGFIPKKIRFASIYPLIHICKNIKNIKNDGFRPK